jgi:hypothetical protein
MYRIMSEETDKTFMNEMICSIIDKLKKIFYNHHQFIIKIKNKTYKKCFYT